MDENDGVRAGSRASHEAAGASSPKASIPDADRLAEWLHSFDTGLSSKAIFHYMTLGVKGGCTPWDSSDLGRCVRLLDRFPEWNARMPEMVCVSDDWAALMSIWDELVAAYREDINGGSEGVHRWRSDEMLDGLFWDHHEGFSTRRNHGFTAQGDRSPKGGDGEAGSVHESPVAEGHAPETPSIQGDSNV